MSDTNKCPLCNRELAEPIVRHHLIPPSKGGKDSPTVPMHKICQAKVHAVFTETELKSYYNTVERIKEHEEISKFIKGVSKKELEFFDTSIKKKWVLTSIVWLGLLKKTCRHFRRPMLMHSRLVAAVLHAASNILGN